MQHEELFHDKAVVQIVTPYRRLRKLRGWSQEKAAEVFHVSKHLIIDIERGTRDPCKQLVRAMDKEYGCNGKLIDYWLPKFSIAGSNWFVVIKKLLRRVVIAQRAHGNL